MSALRPQTAWASLTAWGRCSTTDVPSRTGPAFYTVYETTVTDEDAYKKALPEAQKIIKDAGGTYIAGGFNKAKVNYGKPEAGN